MYKRIVLHTFHLGRFLVIVSKQLIVAVTHQMGLIL